MLTWQSETIALLLLPSLCRSVTDCVVDSSIYREKLSSIYWSFVTSIRRCPIFCECNIAQSPPSPVVRACWNLVSLSISRFLVKDFPQILQPHPNYFTAHGTLWLRARKIREKQNYTLRATHTFAIPYKVWWTHFRFWRSIFSQGK